MESGCNPFARGRRRDTVTGAQHADFCFIRSSFFDFFRSNFDFRRSNLDFGGSNFDFGRDFDFFRSNLNFGRSNFFDFGSSNFDFDFMRSNDGRSVAAERLSRCESRCDAIRVRIEPEPLDVEVQVESI